MYYLRVICSSKFFKILSLFTFGVLLAISLATYSEFDTSLNTASDIVYFNALGSFGAYVADIFYQFIGATSWLIVITSILLPLNLIRGEQIKSIKLNLLYSFVSSLTLGILLAHYFSFEKVGFYKFFLQKLTLLEYEYFIVITGLLTGVGSFLFLYSLGASANFYFHLIRKTLSIIYYSFIRIISLCAGIIYNIFFKNKNGKIASNIAKLTQKLQSKKPAQSSKDPSTKTYNKDNLSEQLPAKDFASDSNFSLPPLDLLQKDNNKKIFHESEQELKEKADQLIKVLKDFGVKGQIIEINQGPVVTLFEFEPAAGTKSSRVIALADDIARTMCTISARISVIPGRNVLGIELPNKEREFFRLRELLESDSYLSKRHQLPIVLGKNLAGKSYVADLSKMPHLLVAGTTGSGKSVAVNAMIVSLLYRYTPSKCRFIMIDPKMLELSVYDGIPHLLTPVVTDPSKAVVALKWAVKEMENRYRLMANLGVRNIYGYNERIRQAIKKGEEITKKVQTGFEPDTGRPIYESVAIEMKELPFIVVIVDEMADLMLVAGKDIESSIQRLAQMARAAGIHLIMATQRPSVDVITGVIKANFPSRISFKVTSKIDSRTIIGEQGSEQLLGMGDMLYMGAGSGTSRVHGPFVDDNEVENVSKFLKDQATPEYITSVTTSDDQADPVQDMMNNESDSNDDDGLYRKAVQIVKRDRKASTSYIQRSLRIGYNRAAILTEKMEKEGIISPPNHSGKREILINDE